MFTEKHVLVKIIITIKLIIALPQRARVKNSHWMERHWLSGEEKVLSTAISKESHVDSVFGLERHLLQLISLKKAQL